MHSISINCVTICYARLNYKHWPFGYQGCFLLHSTFVILPSIHSSLICNSEFICKACTHHTCQVLFLAQGNCMLSDRTWLTDHLRAQETSSSNLSLLHRPLIYTQQTIIPESTEGWPESNPQHSERPESWNTTQPEWSKSTSTLPRVTITENGVAGRRSIFLLLLLLLLLLLCADC